MNDWLRGIDLGDVVHVAVTRYTLTGSPSCVSHAILRVTLTGGQVHDVPVRFEHQPMYETLVGDVAMLNRQLWARAARRR